jgi:hypothetical protein
MTNPQETTCLLLCNLDGVFAFCFFKLLLLDEEDGGERVRLGFMAAIQLPSLIQANLALRIALQSISFDKLPSHNYNIFKSSV